MHLLQLVPPARPGLWWDGMVAGLRPQSLCSDFSLGSVCSEQKRNSKTEREKKKFVARVLQSSEAPTAGIRSCRLGSRRLTGEGAAAGSRQAHNRHSPLTSPPPAEPHPLQAPGWQKGFFPEAVLR